MTNEYDKNKDIAHHIFNGSIAMVGVCLTIVTLFKITDFGMKTLADELLGADSFVFIIAAFISYLSLRKSNNKKLEWIADILFFSGMLVMVIIGLFLVITPW